MSRELQLLLEFQKSELALLICPKIRVELSAVASYFQFPKLPKPPSQMNIYVISPMRITNSHPLSFNLAAALLGS
jgi:hypothetical protein